MCAYTIYHSNTLAGFVKKYPEKFISDSLFNNTFCLVVQNRNIGEWLKLEMAETRGICADFQYAMPENALRDFCRGYPAARALLGEPEKPVLFLDNLKLILYQLLGKLLRNCTGNDPVYGELYRYIHSGDPVNTKERERVRSGRLYDLADSIAGLFNHYGMNCQSLVAPWEKGEPFEPMPGFMRKHEIWQRHLWNKLFHKDQPYLHLSQLLSAVMKSEDSYDGTIERVVIFGSSFLGDTGLKFFHHLSRDIPVDHFILSPSRSYSHWQGGVSHPLLRSWSTLIGGFATLSEEFENTEKFIEYTDPGGVSLLNMIQSDLLEDRVPGRKREVPDQESSLSIHTFTSPWREVEVLKDLILNALNRDPTLKLTDICILAPDINVYAPFLEALFPSVEDHIPQRDHLPFNVVDLSGTSDSPFIQGFIQLFSLPGEKFTRKDLFLLFDNPCFCEAFQINRAERDFWLDLCESLNIKWGINATHKKDFFPDATDFNSWEEGFRRLSDGFFLEEQDDPGLPYGLPDEAGCQSAGKLMGVVEGLFHDLYELNRIRLPLDKWVLLSESLMECYLLPRDGDHQDSRDRWRLKGTFRDLISLAEDSVLPDGGEEAMDFNVFRILLMEFIRKSGGERGRYLTQGITCSSLKPLRAIPFRRIYMLGLNEGVFPGEDLHLSFDLRELVQQTIDLSRRGSDKYAFLETLLSAKEALTLFYHDRDPVRGEALQPSVLISELLEYLDSSFSFAGNRTALQALQRRESIHNYDPRYFSGGNQFLSFNRSALKSAQIALLSDKADLPAAELVREHPDKEGILTLNDLEQFLKNPGAYFFNKALGVYLDIRDNREEESQENWESAFLDRYLYLNSFLENPRALDEPDLLEKHLKEQQKRGNLPDSDLIFLEEDYFRERIEEVRNQLEEKGLQYGLSSPRDYLISPESLSYRNLRDDALHPQVIIPEFLVSLPEGDSVSFAGHLEELSPSAGTGGEWETLEYCESGEPSARHYLKSYLKSLVMSALSESGVIPEFKRLKLYMVGKRSYPVILFDMTGEPENSDILRVNLEDAGERFTRLAGFCLDQKEKPLMIYPELGEALAQELDKQPDLGDQELLDLYRMIWEKKSTSPAYRGGHSPFAECTYRKRFMPEPPAADPERLRDFIELVYLPLARKGQAEKEESFG